MQPIYSGTVAVGAAVTGVDVIAKCADGNTYSTKTDKSGKFSFWAGISPCSFEVKTAQGVMQSISAAPGVVNITPLTDLGVRWAMADPNKLQSAKQTMLASLPNWGVSLYEDPFTTAFNADGTGHDKTIFQYVTFANAGVLTTGEGSNLPSVIEFGANSSGECTDRSFCYPVEAALNQIPDDQIRELADSFLDNLNVDVTFGTYGLLSEG